MSERVQGHTTGRRTTARKASTPPPTPREELEALAAASINAYPNSSTERVQYVWEHIEGDIEMISELFSPYRDSIISSLISKVRNDLREKAGPTTGGGYAGERNPDAEPAARPEGSRKSAPTTKPDLEGAGAPHQRSMLQAFQVNGRALAEVTTAEAYAWLRSHKRDGYFVELVLSGVPENDTLVGDHCTDDEANAFYQRAQNSGR